MEFDNSVNLSLNSSMVSISDFFILVKDSNRCLGYFLLPNLLRKVVLKATMVENALSGRLSYRFPALLSKDKENRVMYTSFVNTLDIGTTVF